MTTKLLFKIGETKLCLASITLTLIRFNMENTVLTNQTIHQIITDTFLRDIARKGSGKLIDRNQEKDLTTGD